MLTIIYVLPQYSNVIVSVGTRLFMVETKCMPWREKCQTHIMLLRLPSHIFQSLLCFTIILICIVVRINYIFITQDYNFKKGFGVKGLTPRVTYS